MSGGIGIGSGYGAEKEHFKEFMVTESSAGGNEKSPAHTLTVVLMKFSAVHM